MGRKEKKTKYTTFTYTNTFTDITTINIDNNKTVTYRNIPNHSNINSKNNNNTNANNNKKKRKTTMITRNQEKICSDSTKDEIRTAKRTTRIIQKQKTRTRTRILPPSLPLKTT